MTDPVPSAGGTGAGQQTSEQKQESQHQTTRKSIAEEKKKTIVIGLSGPSSSGKTTLARLLKTIFSVSGRVRTFIIHEDDFYFPDDKWVLPTASFFFLTDNKTIYMVLVHPGECD